MASIAVESNGVGHAARSFISEKVFRASRDDSNGEMRRWHPSAEVGSRIASFDGNNYLTEIPMTARAYRHRMPATKERMSFNFSQSLSFPALLFCIGFLSIYGTVREHCQRSIIYL